MKHIQGGVMIFRNILIAVLVFGFANLSFGFTVQEGTSLRHVVDDALLRCPTNVADLRDPQSGQAYRLTMTNWQGSCRSGTLTARGGDTAPVSVCRQGNAAPGTGYSGMMPQSREQQMLTQRFGRSLSDTTVGAQYGLRGNPNAPHQRIQPLIVDQNAMYQMSPAQFEEYRRRLDWANDYHGRVIQNDRSAAEAAVRWTSGGYNNSYRQQQIPNAVQDGIANTIRRGFNQIQF
jgi:hypothetical protein